MKFAESLFKISFSAYGFAISSCLFKTGITMSLFSVALICSLVICADFRRFTSGQRIEFAGIAILLWFALTLIWSERSNGGAIEALWEYRVFFVAPPLVVAARAVYSNVGSVMLPFMIGASVAIIASYALYFGLIEVEGASRSLANRIYHGFLVAIAVYIFIAYADQKSGGFKAVLVVMSLLGVFSVFGVEKGRTGYIAVFAVLVFVTFLKLGLIRTLILSAFGIFSLVVISYSENEFTVRILQTVGNLSDAISGQYRETSIGLRMEYYSTALRIIKDNFWFGLGILDVENEFLEKYLNGEIRILTDNVHSEFLNFFLIGGVIAFSLFCYYLYELARMANFNSLIDAFPFAIFLVLTIYCLFNSSLKDFGEKQLYIYILVASSLMCAGDRCGHR